MQNRTINWNQVVEDLGPRLYRYFCGTFSAPIASEAVQETLLRLVQKQRDGSFDPSKGDLVGYGFGIARLVRLELSQGKRLKLIPDDYPTATDDSYEVELKSEMESRRIQLRRAIAKLKPVEQDIILLNIDSELTLEQIANTLQMPIGTVKSHTYRAKESLRQIMEVINE